MAAPVKLQRATTSINHPKSSVAPRLGKFFSHFILHTTHTKRACLADKPHHLRKFICCDFATARPHFCNQYMCSYTFDVVSLKIRPSHSTMDILADKEFSLGFSTSYFFAAFSCDLFHPRLNLGRIFFCRPHV
jgi:hypothetical protein